MQTIFISNKDINQKIMLQKKFIKSILTIAFSLNLKELVNIHFNPPQYHWMKGILDVTENIKLKKTELKDRCGNSMDPS